MYIQWNWFENGNSIFVKVKVIWMLCGWGLQIRKIERMNMGFVSVSIMNLLVKRASHLNVENVKILKWMDRHGWMDGWMLLVVWWLCKIYVNQIQFKAITFHLWFNREKKRIRVPHCNRFVDFSSIHFDEIDCIDSVNMKTVRWCMLFNINSHRYK